MPQTHRSRIRHTLAGEQVDRPPISFWAHNFARENSAEELAAETVRVYETFGWDFLKIQSRASAFAEAWGNQYTYSDHFATPPTLRHHAVQSPQDLAALRPLDPTQGALGEQLHALRLIRQALGRNVPILHTVFAPAMVLGYLVDGQPAVLDHIRHSPDAVHSALAALRQTLAAYAQACLENGADGIFLAIKAADTSHMSRAHYQEFGLPYDRPILDAAAKGTLNMLHLCGDHLYFEVVDDLPSHLVNWALSPHNPSLREGRARAGRTVIGGVSPKPEIRAMTPNQIAAQVLAALDETDGLQTMIGPGCSISPDTPAANLHAAKAALDTWAAQQPVNSR